MPPKRNDDKFTDMLEEALKPVKEAMKNLITEEAMKELINGLEEKLVKKINEQAKEIENLRNRYSHLEGRVAILEHLVKVQEMQCDDTEQYGRRLCLRVDDMPVSQNETPYTVEDELHKEFNRMGVNIPHHAIDRAHRIGKKFDVQNEDEDGNVTGVTVKQQVIVKFTSWRYRTEVYQKRRSSKKLRFKIDLTKRRLNLLKHARQLIKDIDEIDYVFSDVNCRLNVKFGDGRVRAFNSDTELAAIISSADAN